MSPEPTIPPGPRMPRALQTLGWGRRPMPFMERCQRRYGDVFTIRIAQEGTWVFLAHPDAVKQVFTGDPRLLHAGEGNVILLPLVGDRSVLLLDEAEHMTQRKLMLPAFHGERMRRYEEIMREATEAEIAGWPTGEPLAVWPRTQAITLEVIMRAVFGLHEGRTMTELRGVLSEAMDWGAQTRQMLLLALLGPRRVAGSKVFQRMRAPMDELLVGEIRRRREDPDLSEREDVLSMLVQARYDDGSPMSDQELRDQLITLLVAGHETTATSLAWAIERLVHTPDTLERLEAEIDQGEDAYLDAVIKETLRLRPVLPIVIRRLTAPMEIGGHLLPRGVSVAPCIHLIHRRPDIYPEPDRFLPERFLERPAGAYTWIPFGGGVRRCLGASFAQFEMKTVLRTLIASRQLRPSGRPERVRRRTITLTPERGGEVVVSAREPRSEPPATAPVAAGVAEVGA